MIAAIDGRPLPPVEARASRRVAVPQPGRRSGSRPGPTAATSKASAREAPPPPRPWRPGPSDPPLALTALPDDPELATSPSRRRPSIAGVIFDLDGVIVDSEIWWDEVRQAFAADHGRRWTVDDRHAVMGANSRQWSETMRRRLELDLPAEAIERAIVDGVIARYRREGAPAIDGAVEAVRRIAADLPVALASSSHPAVIDAALAATGLEDTFPVVVSSDEVSHGKPAPDVFLEAARRLGDRARPDPGRRGLAERPEGRYARPG